MHFYNRLADTKFKYSVNNKTWRVQSLQNSFRPRVCCYGRLEGSNLRSGGFIPVLVVLSFLSTKPYLIRGTVDEGTTGFIVYLTGSNRNRQDSLTIVSANVITGPQWCRLHFSRRPIMSTHLWWSGSGTKLINLKCRLIS